MKVKQNNLIYSVKLDPVFFEYRLKNSIVKSLYELINFNTYIAIPLNIILNCEIKKAWIGHIISFSILEYSTRRTATFKTRKLHSIWLFNNKISAVLQQEIDNSNRFNPYYQMNRPPIKDVYLLAGNVTLQAC
ncbi:MAG: hypothetical protein ACI9Z3_000862 [Roseivirga sp.]|jgi:hypothetical protein